MRGNDVTMDAIKYLERKTIVIDDKPLVLDPLMVSRALREFKAALRYSSSVAVENARRLSALAAVCVAAECTGEDGWQRCVICDEVAQPDATIRHADGCPIGHARRALDAP